MGRTRFSILEELDEEALELEEVAVLRQKIQQVPHSMEKPKDKTKANNGAH